MSRRKKEVNIQKYRQRDKPGTEQRKAPVLGDEAGGAAGWPVT